MASPPGRGIHSEDDKSPAKLSHQQRLVINGNISNERNVQQSNIVIPETPSPCMSKKRKQPPSANQHKSPVKYTTSVKLGQNESSSSGSDNDIPLLSQRIFVKKKKLVKINGTVSGHSSSAEIHKPQVTGNSGRPSLQHNKHIDASTKFKREMKHTSDSLKKRPKTNVDLKNDDSTVKHRPSQNASFSSPKLKSGSKHSKSTSSSSDTATRSPIFSKTNKHSEKYRSLGDAAYLYQSDSSVPVRKSCMVEQQKANSKAGTSVRREKAQMSELFGSDSDSDNNRMHRRQQQKSKRIFRTKNLHPDKDRGETKLQKNSVRRNPILSDDDGTDTEPDDHVLPSDVRPRNKKAKHKMVNKNQPHKKVAYKKLLKNLISDSDSEVELMEISSPERSPVFDRSGRNLQLSAEELIPERLESQNPRSHQTLRNTRSRHLNRHTDDCDVVTIDDDIEEVILPNSNRRSQVTTSLSNTGSQRNNNQRSFELVSRLSGAVGSAGRYQASTEFGNGTLRSELGSPINAEHFYFHPPAVSSSPDSSSRPSPSLTRRSLSVSPRRRRIRRPIAIGGSSSIEHSHATDPSDQTPNTRSGDSISEQQRQLDADEQFARDLASGKIRTPGQREKRISRVDSNRRRQMAEDEELARQFASGRLSTPVGQEAASSSMSNQVEDDEAMARRLQEEFNSEAALEEHHHHHDHPDMSVTTSTQINTPQYPFSFQYEFGMQSSRSPYPSFQTPGALMNPVVFGDPMVDSSPPSRRRSRRRRGRGGSRRGGRSRVNSGFHIQFFPMNETLDDDYESLWELSERVGPAVQQGLGAEVLSLLPTFQYKPESGQSEAEGEGKNCTICMMDYEDGENLRRLPCFHDYHTACIDRWLTNNSACPVCQTKVSLDQHLHD